MTATLLFAFLGLVGGLGAAARVYARQQRRIARSQYQEQLEEALADGDLSPDESAGLESLRAESSLSDTEARAVALEVYRRSLEAAMGDARITETEDAMLGRLQRQLGITETDLLGDREAMQRLHLLAGIERGILPVVEPPFPLDDDEICHWIVRATLCNRLDLRGGGKPPASLDFDVADGVAYALGGPRDTLADRPDILPVDMGILGISSRRTIFQGANRRLAIAHLDVERLVLFRDGFRLEPGSHHLLVDDSDLTGAILLRVARHRRQERESDDVIASE